MSTTHRTLTRLRTRWSAVGAAVAVTLGAGGIGLVQASTPAPVDVTVTISPERILDTRSDLGLAGPFQPNAPRNVQVTGAVEVATDSGTTTKTVVPDGASAVLVNVTVTEPTDVGFLTLRPAGATGLPATSTVNFAAGATEPNAATVALSSDGKLQVWVFMPTASATAQVLIDVVGYTTSHDHDDRYYTETEVDGKLATKANTSALAAKANSADVYTKSQVDAITSPLYAAIQSNGDVYNDTESGLVSSTRTGVGAYTLTFDRDVDMCVATTSDSIFAGTRDVSADPTIGSANEVGIVITNETDTNEDSDFAVILACPPVAPAPAAPALDGAVGNGASDGTQRNG